MNQKEPLIQYESVSIGYSKKSPVLSGLSFVIESGDFIGLIGPNGSGKTTLLKSLLGLQKPLSGQIEINDREIRFGYVKQRQTVDELFPLSVGEVVLMGRYGMMGFLRRPQKEDWEQVRKALMKLDSLKLIQQPYRDLSGGQKQRVLIARALASEPTVLILDEPTNDLDVGGEHQIMELLKQINQEEGITVIVVTHILNVVLGYAKKIALTGLDKFVFDSIEKIATSETLSQLYQHQIKVKEVDGKRVILPCD